jgi:uncharacterized phage-associated protein
MHDTMAVANFFIQTAKNHGKPVTHMKLQKMLYFAHGWYLAMFDQPLLDEQVEAWKYGPVIPSVYHEFKACGGDPIKHCATTMILNSDGHGFSFREPELEAEQEELDVLNEVWDAYGGFTGIQLSDMTHRDNTPWHKVWFKQQGIKGTDIPQDLIQQYFNELYDSQESSV